MNQYYQRPRKNTGELLKEIFFSKNILSRLILVNTVIFLAANIVLLFTWLFTGQTQQLSLLGSYLALPADLTQLAQKPWTVFTYMFLHEGFFHWFFNMVLLYFGGLLFLEYLNQRKLLITYLLGGLSGALFFIVAFNVFPAFATIRPISVALGASASILAIIIAIAAYVPDYHVHLFLIGRVPLKYLAVALVIIDILSIQSQNPGGHIAHLGGALWGFVYGLSLRKGTDFYRVFDGWHFPKLSKKRYAKFTTERPKSGRPMTDEEYNKRRVTKEHEIDAILDKIAKSGYGSLSKEEKEFLFKNSNKQ